MGIVVKAQAVEVVKRYNREKGYKVNNITGDFFPALDRKVREIIEKAVDRADENKRRSVMGRDV